jgi:hypothetical protein
MRLQAQGSRDLGMAVYVVSALTRGSLKPKASTRRRNSVKPTFRMSPAVGQVSSLRELVTRVSAEVQ